MDMLIESGMVLRSRSGKHFAVETISKEGIALYSIDVGVTLDYLYSPERLWTLVADGGLTLVQGERFDVEAAEAPRRERERIAREAAAKVREDGEAAGVRLVRALLRRKRPSTDGGEGSE